MRSIVFASGKGGVGKTSISLNLGLMLAQAGKKTVVVDADLDMANVSIMLGVELNPITLHNVLLGENNVSDAVYEGPAKLSYVPASLSEETKDFDYGHLRNAVTKLESSYEYVLIDCPPGLREEVQAIISSSRELILVVTPEPTSVVDALKVKKYAERIGTKITGVVLNRVTGEKSELKPNEIEPAVGLHVLASLPEDPEVKKSALLQVPVVLRAPNAPFSKAMRILASKITLEPLRIEEPSVGFLQRIKNFFKKIFGK